MIQFRCECGRELQGREEDVGRQAKCPVCARLVTIPPADEPRPSLPPRHEDRDDRRSERYADRPEAADRREADDRPRRRDRSDDDRRPADNTGKVLGATGIIIAVVCVVGCLGLVGGVALLLPAVQKVRQASMRMQEANNLKQIGLALHNHHDMHGFLPAGGNSPRPDGKPRVSWRVQILPFLEQDNLYRLYNVNEPWDGPTNSRLRNSMPKVYETPGKPAPPGMTYIQVVVGPGTLFEDPMKMAGGFDLPPDQRRIRFGGVTDGTSNTIMVVVGNAPVPWSSPEDIAYDPNGPLPQFSEHFSGGTNILMADGSVRFLRKGVSATTLRALLSRNRGDMPGTDW